MPPYPVRPTVSQWHPRAQAQAPCPTGFEAFAAVRHSLEQRGVDYEAVDQEWTGLATADGHAGATASRREVKTVGVYAHGRLVTVVLPASQRLDLQRLRLATTDPGARPATHAELADAAPGPRRRRAPPVRPSRPPARAGRPPRPAPQLGPRRTAATTATPCVSARSRSSASRAPAWSTSRRADDVATAEAEVVLRDGSTVHVRPIAPTIETRCALSSDRCPRARAGCATSRAAPTSTGLRQPRPRSASRAAIASWRRAETIGSWLTRRTAWPAGIAPRSRSRWPTRCTEWASPRPCSRTWRRPPRMPGSTGSRRRCCRRTTG